MRNIKLLIEYDGTNYHGWQRQPGLLTIQQIIEDAIERITGNKTPLLGSGRTDAGVHALGQVANFKTDSNIELNNIDKALNSMLPDDIVILKAEEADLDFHSQYDSLNKTYIYKILNRTNPSALNQKRVWHIPYKLNVRAMQNASTNLVGEHDFCVFSKTGSGVKTTVRKVLGAEFAIMDNDLIEFHIQATGFLKGMVRLIVGTLANIGKEKITETEFEQIIKTGNKHKFIKSAPSHGLYLAKVNYGCY